MGYPNRAQKTDRAGNPPMKQTLAQLISSSMGNNPGASPNAYPVSTPGSASGSTLVGKNQTPFATDNPYQSYAGLPLNPALDAINRNVTSPFVDDGSITPLSSKTIVGNGGMVWNGTQMVPAGTRPPPISLTVTGGGTPYNNRGWGAGLLPPWMPQGADPGMGGLGILGDTPMNPGIPAQMPPADGSSPLPRWRGDVPSAGGYSLPRPGLPMSGQVGARHNGSSNLPAAHTSGGYLFDRNGAQIGRDYRYRAEPGSRGTAAGSDNNSRFETTAVQRANYDRQGISY